MSDREREDIFSGGELPGQDDRSTDVDQADRADKSAGDLAGDGDQGSVYNPQYEPRPSKKDD